MPVSVSLRILPAATLPDLRRLPSNCAAWPDAAPAVRRAMDVAIEAAVMRVAVMRMVIWLLVSVAEGPLPSVVR